MSDVTNSNVLEVRRLNKRFGDVHAVRDLNFDVRKGEVFGFLGPNGAGKTTTMRIVTCFIPASSGDVNVSGYNSRDNSMEIRRMIGYLPESNPLYNDMLVNEYLNLVGEIRGLKGSQLEKRTDEMYQVCGLTKMTQRQIGTLSKGYRQRVGLAQAMLHNPDLLILDEPMSGLDPNQIIEIRRLIKKIGEEKTVIYCSHILPEVAATCNRILIINEGKGVATGTADELTSRMNKGGQYSLRIKGDKAVIENKLNTLNGVSSTTASGAGDGWFSVRVMAEGGDELGETLYKCAVDNGWVLSELKKESASLEDVFTQLTRG